MKKCVSVVSGGVDSVTMMLAMLERGYDVRMLHFDYHQKSNVQEYHSCIIIEKWLKDRAYSVRLMDLKIPFFKYCLNNEMSVKLSLLDNTISIPEGMDSLNMSIKGGGNLFVPARNVIFLSIAASLAESIGAEYITLGANMSEASYGDNTKEFLDKFTELLELGCHHNHPKVIAPLYDCDKVELIRWGFEKGYRELYKHTWSCDGKGEYKEGAGIVPCGKCGCCCNRRVTFTVAEEKYGIKDEQLYKDENFFYDNFLHKFFKSGDGEKLWFNKYRDILKRKLEEVST